MVSLALLGRRLSHLVLLTVAVDPGVRCLADLPFVGAKRSTMFQEGFEGVSPADIRGEGHTWAARTPPIGGSNKAILTSGESTEGKQGMSPEDTSETLSSRCNEEDAREVSVFGLPGAGDKLKGGAGCESGANIDNGVGVEVPAKSGTGAEAPTEDTSGGTRETVDGTGLAQGSGEGVGAGTGAPTGGEKEEERAEVGDLRVGKRKDYLPWDDYFMSVAFLSAMRSKDPSTQVGACIVNQEKRIVGIGYNGFPMGCSDDELPWARTAENELDTKYPYVCHAEMNAILNKNSADVRGCRIYVALFPCNECAKLIIQSGIEEVVYLSDKYHSTPSMTASRRLFNMSGVKYRQHVPQRSSITIDFSWAS